MHVISCSTTRAVEAMSCNLAYWHTYKQAVKMIWKYFADTIWGPLWHRMYPGSKFNVCHPSPQEGSMHLMARAYPKFMDELENAIAREGLKEASKAMLLNFQFLCEFAIPAAHSRMSNSARTFQWTGSGVI